MYQGDALKAHPEVYGILHALTKGRLIVNLLALKASLALWQRRYAARVRLRSKARQDLLEARELDTHPRKALVERKVLREQQAKTAKETARAAHASCLRSMTLGPLIANYYALDPNFPRAVLKQYRSTIPKSCPKAP